MKSIFLITAVVFIAHIATAQNKQRLAFASYNSAGFVAGKLPLAFAAQTQNGVMFKNWFVGAGFGIDNYYVRTLPLFGIVKKIIPLKNNAFFLYGSMGSNLIATNKTQRTPYFVSYTKGALYTDAGAGYLIKAGKKSHVFFSVSNTVKKIEEVEESYDILPGIYDNGVLKFSRISLQMGFQF